MDGLDDILEQWAAFEAANPAEAERYFAAHPDIKAHVGAAQAKRHSSPGRSDRAGNSTPDADIVCAYRFTLDTANDRFVLMSSGVKRQTYSPLSVRVT